VVAERLVHHVPGEDFAPVVGGDVGDVVEHRVAQRGAGEALHPARLLRVPGQRVAADAHVVRLGVADDLVGAAVGERVLGGLGRVPLHLVLGRDHVELAIEDRRVDRIAQLVRGDGGAEVATGGGRRGTERGGRFGAARRDDHRAGRGEERGGGGEGGGEDTPPRGTVHDSFQLCRGT